MEASTFGTWPFPSSTYVARGVPAARGQQNGPNFTFLARGHDVGASPVPRRASAGGTLGLVLPVLPPASPDDPRLADAVDRACRELSIETQVSAVRALVIAPAALWPTCCVADCASCEKAIGRAALRALALLADEPST